MLLFIIFENCVGGAAIGAPAEGNPLLFSYPIHEFYVTAFIGRPLTV